MIYPPLDLRLVGLLVGLLLVTSHLFALLKPGAVQAWLKRLPRSRAWGTVFIIAATIWWVVMVSKMDLGEFSSMRNGIILVSIAAAIASWLYLDDFLAVRSLGMIALLAAEPVLEACWMRPEIWRLSLVVLAYAWVIAGLFLVGMPFLLRDRIAWSAAADSRWRAICIAGVAYGGIVLAGCALGK